MGDNVETVLRLENAWMVHDYDTVRQILSPDFADRNHGVGAEMMPKGGVEGIIEGHEVGRASYSDRKQEILDCFGEGDRVVVRSRMTGTNDGGLPWFGIPPTATLSISNTSRSIGWRTTGSSSPGRRWRSPR